MRYTPLEIPGVLRIDIDRQEDDRGFFSRLFCSQEMAVHGLDTNIAQCNNSLTNVQGTVRGLHFQHPPATESKFVRCIRGAAFDVAVDLRHGSSTYGKWCSLELNDHDRCMIYLPQGFAHGFQTLHADTELLYFHSHPYDPQLQGGLDPLDPDLAVSWPLPVVGLSERDRSLPGLTQLRPTKL